MRNMKFDAGFAAGSSIWVCVAAAIDLTGMELCEVGLYQTALCCLT